MYICLSLYSRYAKTNLSLVLVMYCINIQRVRTGSSGNLTSSQCPPASCRCSDGPSARLSAASARASLLSMRVLAKNQ